MPFLLIALMYSEDKILNKAITELESKFGKIQSRSEEYDFTFTNYYEKEFGKGLKKIFVAFQKGIASNSLAEIKKFTNDLEKQTSSDGKRLINIDAGYIDENSLVMASNKRMSFKEEISDGIYAHRILEFKDGKWHDFHHTFRDYRMEKNKKFFISVRQTLENEKAILN